MSNAHQQTLNSDGTFYGYNVIVGTNPSTAGSVIRAYGDGTNVLIDNAYYSAPTVYPASAVGAIAAGLGTTMTGESLPVVGYAPGSVTTGIPSATAWNNVAGTGTTWASIFGGPNGTVGSSTYVTGSTVGGTGGSYAAGFGTPST